MIIEHLLEVVKVVGNYMIELKFIGRGSAFTKDEVNNSAYFIKNNTMVLFDCGADVFKQIINHKLLNQPNINKLLIIITHTHDDHIGSLMSLLEYCRYSNRAANIEEVQLFETIESLVGVVPASPYQTRLNTFANIFGMSIEWLKKVVVVSKSQVEDEFAGVIEGNRDDVKNIFTNIFEELRNLEYDPPLSLSVGINKLNVNKSYIENYREVDSLLYKVKKDGKNSFILL